ncbi:MAG: hypothetical protein AAFQ11_06075 [Pseudomonadota bacterium]
MAARRGNKLGNEVIKIPARVHPFLIVLLLVASGCALASIATIVLHDIPIYAKGMLLLVTISSAAIAFNCMKFFSGTTITIGEANLEVDGPEGRQSFPFGKIESVQVVGATGSLADDPFRPIEKRIGLAIFLKGGPEGRMDVNQADAILTSGENGQGEMFVNTASKINSAIKKRGTPGAKNSDVPKFGAGRMRRTPRAARTAA